jgi:hypothetical protein
MVINMSLSHIYKIKRAVFIVNYEVRGQKSEDRNLNSASGLSELEAHSTSRKP